MKETGKQYWRSLDQLAGTREFREWLEREFPSHASELAGGTTSRRRLLQLMAASFGLAGLTSCRRPAENILPSSVGSEDQIPGVPLYYATVMRHGGSALGLLVECHDGRPTKIEGNPKHPASGGTSTAYAQASILDLYDPDRSRSVLHAGQPSTWQEFEAFASAHFDPARMGQGERLRFLSETILSPSLEAVRSHTVARFPKARWIEYDALSEDQVRAGATLAFGAPLRPHYRFEQADVVLALDCDFLGMDMLSPASIRDFSRRRRVSAHGDSMSRLYAVESHYSITGAVADHRLRLAPGEVRRFAVELARRLRALPGSAAPGESRSLAEKWVAAVARDLERHRGKCLVVTGPRQPAEVHALAHLINHALGASGATVTYTRWPRPSGESQAAALLSLAEELRAGRVETLVILGGNPVFTAPREADLGALMRKTPVTIRLGLEEDETSETAAWRLPEAHYLESWGDARAADGTASIQQPLIAPLHGGRTAAEVAALLTGYRDRRAYDIVRNYWLPRWPAAEGEKLWRRALHDGVIPETGYPAATPSVDAARVAKALDASGKPLPPGTLEILFLPGWAAWDGRFLNNGWLQETPEPMTKLTWDNAALISPATARRLGLAGGDVVALSLGGSEVEMPVLVQPGHADGCVSVSLGYGRKRCGRVGRNTGFNAYPLRPAGAPWTAPGVEVRKTGRKHRLAVTQNHHSLEGRPLVVEATLEEYRRDPQKVTEAARPHEELFSLYKEPSYKQGYQWGMAIDLNACVGCNACVVACQAENNVPIVGKEQVMRGREMHWIRVDRYFEGPAGDPQSVMLPVTCQQCENAPCENVCPVAATTHSPEGLNDMAYNRCVGTRYCSNNCPYKVRRFNFLNWHKGLSETGKMVFNPDVTVRMRGVMEKCTYCVQRIEEKRIQAIREGHRPLRDGEIVTACQQACPAEAIVFGDINDPASRVSRLRNDKRRYSLLEELNTRPRTTYLARLRNPNPELE